jgi:hypothetical protein
VPRVVREEVTSSPDGTKLYQLHLQWRCKYGLTSGKPERYQVQCIQGLSSEVEVVYEGEDQFFVTKPLPDGMYSFKVQYSTQHTLSTRTVLTDGLIQGAGDELPWRWSVVRD